MMEIETISMIIWIIDFPSVAHGNASHPLKKARTERLKFSNGVSQFHAKTYFANWNFGHTHGSRFPIPNFNFCQVLCLRDAYNVSVQLLLPHRKLTRCKSNEEQIFQHGHASEGMKEE